MEKTAHNFAREDADYLYFVSETPSLSSFLIAGSKTGTIKNVEIFYPKNVITFLNTDKIVYIQIKNSDIEPLHNLRLVLQGLELDWFTIIPSSTIVNPDKTQEFAIEIKIPADASIKQYPVKLWSRAMNSKNFAT